MEQNKIIIYQTMRTIMLMMAGWLLCMAASAQKETRIYQFDKPL